MPLVQKWYFCPVQLGREHIIAQSAKPKSSQPALAAGFFAERRAPGAVAPGMGKHLLNAATILFFLGIFAFAYAINWR
ncbi:MAG TPA: hypothetical protein VEC11_01730 [Allosphingosinicella sp.]|nr:hypothetical protein [Allosphingosinicella sp.]